MITGFFKLIFGTIRLAFFLAVLALVFHTWALRQALQVALSWTLGADVGIESVKMDWKNTGFEVHDLVIGNPRKFPEGTLADIPLAIVSIDLPAISQGVVHLKTVGVNVREIRVIHSAGRGLNLMELKPLKKNEMGQEASRPSQAVKRKIKERMPGVVIDELILSIGDLTFTEMLGTFEKQKRVRMDIQGVTFYDLRGAGDVTYVVVSLALKKLGYNLLGEPFQQFSVGAISGSSGGGFWDKIKKAITE